MARKSRYAAYIKAISKREKRKSSPVSVLKKLQELKGQNVVISIPIGQDFSQQTQGGGGD